MDAEREGFEELADSTPVGLFRCDREGRYIYVNERWRQLSGLTGPNPLGDGWVEALHPDDRERVHAAWRDAVSSGGTFAAEYRFRHAGGGETWVLGQAVATRGPGDRLLGFVGAITDVTERRRFAQQLLQAQKLEAVGRLAGGVAHDFNNLLTAIMGHAELALGELPEGSPPRESVLLVVEAADRAATLVRQLLGFARKQVAERVPTDLNTVIARASGLLRRLIGEDVEIELVLAPDLWPVRVDPGQIDQVLVNLVVNARDAMPEGGHVILETRNIVLAREDPRLPASLPPGEYVSIAARDTGFGMDAATLAHAFEPFFTTKDSTKGTGLGLAVCHGIVEQNGGHITAQSAAGGGTTIRVYLPRCEESATTLRDRPRPHAVSGTETILIAEDDQLVRDLAARALEQRGYTVLRATDGEAALALAESFDGPIDLLVTDVVMPNMGGRALAASIRGHRPGLRILFVSGYTSDPGVIGDASPTGTAFLRKPYTPESLAEAVRRALST